MEYAHQNMKLFWIAKTERAYLQVLADEACKQLAIRDDVINTQESSLQQKHSGPWAAADELPERCHELVSATDFISSTVADVFRQCLTLRTADLSPTVAAATDTGSNDKGADDGDGHSGDTTPSQFAPTAQAAGDDGCSPSRSADLMTSESLMTSEVHLPRDGESTGSLDALEAQVVAPAEASTAAPETATARQRVRHPASAGTQTATDQMPDRLAQLTAEREDQKRLLRHQTDLLAQLHSQLTRSAAENERLQRHLQLVNALFAQLHRKETESVVGGLDSPRANGADDMDTAAEDGGGGGGGGGDGGELVERVDTVHGRRLVIHVSRTYLRLRDLILEKRSLLSEIDKLRGFNQQLERRLSKQERRLSSVAAELHSTWGLVTKLKIQHAQLHTAESVLRYELREKRKLMSRLRGELEGSRQRSALANQLNAESELEWRALRRELDQRKRERLVRQTRVGSEEAGGETQAGDGTGEPRQGHAAVLERSSTDESQPDGESLPEQDGAELEALDTSVAESESIESESAGRRTPESQPADSTDSAAGATSSAESSLERRRRLVSLEDQCQQLYTRLVSTTARQVALSSRLAELHAQHGASEAETTPETSVASSEDTAYASLAETPSEEEQPPLDRPATATAALLVEAGLPPLATAAAPATAVVLVETAPPPLAAAAAPTPATAAVLVETAVPPLAAVATVSPVTSEPSSPLAVAAQRVAVQTDGGPRALPPLPASQLATETAHRAGEDRALVSAVVAVREPPPGAAQPADVAATAADSDADEPDNSLDEAGEAEEADQGVAGAATACEDDVSRSTADLLEKVGQFLSRTRRGSASAQPAPAPPPPAEPLSSDSETDEAAEAAQLGGTSAGCKLISMLPSRMVHLRREREQLTEHIARLQAQNERIEQKLARMRAERREQRRRGLEDITAKEHLERRVQQLERQLRLQLAERYAVAAPVPTESEHQPHSSPQTVPLQDTEDPSCTGEPADESELHANFPAVNIAAEPPASSAGWSPADEHHDASLQQSPNEFGDSPPQQHPTSELPNMRRGLDPASQLPGSFSELSASNVLQPVATSAETGDSSESPADCQQSDGSTSRQDGAALPGPENCPQVNGTSPDHSTEDDVTPVRGDRTLHWIDANTASPNCESHEICCGDDGATVKADDTNTTELGGAAAGPVSDTASSLGDTVSDSHTAAEENAAPPVTPASAPAPQAEQSPPKVETSHRPVSGAESSLAEEEGVSAPPSAPERPLARLHQQLADARGQLRSVQADCRRARHTLQQVSQEQGTAALRPGPGPLPRARHSPQQMRVTGEQEDSTAEAVAPNQKTVIPPPLEGPTRSQAHSCQCATPRVNYTEFRRRLNERLHSRLTGHRTSRLRPGSLFKRGVARCHMCQGTLRPLLARRFTCHACGQLFCRRCACLAIHLPATGEMRICVHCFYDLSASVPPPDTAANGHGASQSTDRRQAADIDGCSAI